MPVINEEQFNESVLNAESWDLTDYVPDPDRLVVLPAESRLVILQ